MSLIYDNKDPTNILICHSTYWRSFSGNFGLNSEGVLCKIANNGYHGMGLRKIKKEHIKSLYDRIMQLYGSRLLTTVRFNVYGGVVAMDFVWVSEAEFDSMLALCT